MAQSQADVIAQPEGTFRNVNVSRGIYDYQDAHHVCHDILFNFNKTNSSELDSSTGYDV